jgi:apolipoprotein N-acyltransferase
MNNWKIKIFLSVLTGVLLSLCFEPFGLSALAFVAYVPLLFVLESEERFWRMVLYAWTAMFVQSIVSFEWIHFVAREFGGLSWFVSIFILLVFALFTNFSLQIFSIFYYLARKYLKKEKGHIFYLFIIPTLFCLAETLDPKIFKWFLGDALTYYKYMVQFADVFGVTGLSFLIFAFNVCLFLIIKKYLEHKMSFKKILAPASLCIFIPLFLFVYGKQTYTSLKDVQEKCPLVRAGVVQANIGNPIQLSVADAIKFKKEFGLEKDAYVSDMALILKKYKGMTYKLVESTKDLDFIVWPETAFPGYYMDNSFAAVEHKKMVASIGVPFLIGGYYLDSNDKYYNSAILVTPGGQVDLYHKKMLLPFGEYMPLGEYFPFLKNVVPAVSDFSRGSGPAVLKLDVDGLEVRFAPTICYEILSPSYVGAMVAKDTHILLNMSNDSWFGVVEPYQHLRETRMRAVEYRRPIIRSTNTGITALVDITGDVIKRSEHNKEENVIMDVPVCDHRMRSFYSLVGKYFVSLTTIIAVVLIVFSRKKRGR